MIKVKIGFYSLISEVTKIKHLNIELEDNSTLNDLFLILFERFGPDFKDMIIPEAGMINSRIIIMINEINVTDGFGMDTIMNTGDDIALLPAIAGG